MIHFFDSLLQSDTIGFHGGITFGIVHVAIHQVYIETNIEYLFSLCIYIIINIPLTNAIEYLVLTTVTEESSG